MSKTTCTQTMYEYVLITYVSISSSLLVSLQEPILLADESGHHYLSQLSVYETSLLADETGHHPNVHSPCASLPSLRACC